jgi:tetratricopeptide (TPR) repeat protein
MPESNRSGRILVLALMVLAVLAVAGGGYYWLVYRSGPSGLRDNVRAAINAKDYQRAIPLLRQLVKLYPNELLIRYSLADNLRAVAQEADPMAIDPPEAIEHLLQAVKIEPRRVDLLERLLADFQKLHQDGNAGEIAMRLMKFGKADTTAITLAVRHAVASDNTEFLDSISEGLTDETLQDEIIRLAVRVKLHEVKGMTGRIYWEVEPALQRLIQTSSVRLHLIDERYLSFLGTILEGSVRYAPTGAAADQRLLQSVALVDRLTVADLGQTHRLELIEMVARPVSAALRSRVREGLDAEATPAQRTDLDARHRALQKFVDLAEPVFGMGIVSPFVYEQISRAALELENDKLAISMLRRGIQQHSKMSLEKQNELMSVHAQSAMRLIGRGQFEPHREDIVELLRHKHTVELGELMNGLLDFQQGRFADAHDSLSRIPKDSPHSVAASGLMIRVLLTQDRWEEALDLIVLIDDLWPTLPEVTRHWLAEAAGSRDRLKLLKVCCMLRLGHVKPAIEVLSYLDEGQLQSKSRLIRLIELMRSGKSTRCWEVLREARTEDPHDFDLVLGEFGMLLRDKADAGAARLLATFVREHPEQAHAGIAQVEWLRSRGEASAALAALANVRRMAPEPILVWLLSADLLMTEQRASDIGSLVAEMQRSEVATRHIPVVHAYSVLRSEQLDEAAAAMLESSFETHHSNGYTTTAAMATLAEGKGDLAYRQFVAAFSVSSVAARDRGQLLDRIGEEFSNIDVSALAMHVDRLMEDYPAEPALLISAIELALRRGAFETAAKRLDVLETVDAIPGRANFMRARMLLATGLANESLDELQKVLQVAPSHGRARLMAARLEYANREYARALVEIRKLPYPISDTDEASLLLGRTLTRLDRSDEAVTTLTKRVQRDPQRVEPWLALSQAYSALERIDDARAVLEQAMQYHGTDRRLQDSLLDIHMQQGSSETAATLAQSFGGSSPDLLNSMRFALVFLKSGQPDIAANWITRAHMSPNAEANNELVFLDALLLHERGVRHERWELLQAARRRYETLLQRQPGHIAALNGLARLLMRDLKAEAEGVAVVEQIRTSMPLDRLDPEVQATVSEAYRRADRPMEALTIIKRSINQHPDAAALRLEFAAALLDGYPNDPVKEKQAREELQRAAELQIPRSRLAEFKALSERLGSS